MDVFWTELVSFLQYRPILFTTLVHTACFPKRQRETDINAVHVYEDLCAPALHETAEIESISGRENHSLFQDFVGSINCLQIKLNVHSGPK